MLIDLDKVFLNIITLKIFKVKISKKAFSNLFPKDSFRKKELLHVQDHC